MSVTHILSSGPVSVIPVREYNFLCVHKGMRKRRITPLLLKESERRGHIRGVFQALWTAAIRLPSSISVCQ